MHSRVGLYVPHTAVNVIIDGHSNDIQRGVDALCHCEIGEGVE